MMPGLTLAGFYPDAMLVGARHEIGPDGRTQIPMTYFAAGHATLTISQSSHQPIVRKVKFEKSAERPGCLGRLAEIPVNAG